jgi:hypothetical protein
VANNTDGSMVWVKPLANSDFAVILFNSNAQGSLTVHVTWDMLGKFSNFLFLLVRF